MEDFSTELTNETKIRLVKRAIQSPEGWKNLAIALKYGTEEYEARKNNCIQLLGTIAGDKQVETISGKVNFSMILIEQLDYYVHLNEAVKNS